MDLFWRLLLAHLIADFPLQNKAIRAIKHKWYGVIAHALIFGVVCIFAILNLGAKDYIWPYLYIRKVWFIILVLTISHLIIDRLKYFIAVKIGKDTLYLFLIDQALHIGLIYFMTSWAGIVFISKTNFRMLALAVLAIWGLPILLFLIKAQIREGGVHPRAQIREKWQRFAFFERALIFLGIALGTLRAKFFLVFIAVAIIIRVLLKANKDNVPIPIVEWLCTAVIAILALLPELLLTYQ